MLKINPEKITEANVDALVAVCPFGALQKIGAAKVEVTAACKMCGLCVKKGPPGAVEIVREEQVGVDKSAWRGVAVFAEISPITGGVHPVAFELLAKARELARVINEPVYALLIGEGKGDPARELLCYGAESVYHYAGDQFAEFRMDTYAAAFEDFVRKVRPGSILVGATPLGRSLAPRMAARFGTGLTADCTSLEMKPCTDLVQIRPAFGGNIMAEIVTPRTRPQFCTVRYKIFSALERCAEPKGQIKTITKLDGAVMGSVYDILETRPKPPQLDISEAEYIVACGRGVKPGEEMELAEAFARKLGATLACTRPMAEAGYFDPRRQIGLSGRTVKPKLIITLGVSGAVQFVAGMRSSERIIAINKDPEASIFKVAHVGLVADWREVVKRIIGGCND